ncbi:MAG: preprotein translocase subunit SecE [Actinobacteria bacterium]|nr:preprotein translocase subunit SecE [Actinomycetota bacterium]
MARNRQKAKQRKARREQAGPRPAGQPAPSRGDEATDAGVAPPQDAGFANADAVEVKDELQQERKAAKQKAKAATAKNGPAKAAAAKGKAEPKQRGRFISFLRSSWAELRRVQWPDRKQITTMTTIVIGFVIIAGVYLGVIDWAANELVNLII